MGKPIDGPWTQVSDAELVERLIHGIQRAVRDDAGGEQAPELMAEVPAPELAAALLNLLASVLAEAPQVRTPLDLRRLSEAAGKELLVLMRGYRDLLDASANRTAH